LSALHYVRNAVIPAIYELLPSTMDSPEARAMLLAIALQESRFEHRRQTGGPAVSFWQFEVNGVRGVLNHPASRRYITPILKTLLYNDDETECHAAILDNDILAAVFARLLLWTLPQALPKSDQPGEAFDQYSAAWRPGKPRREHWQANFETAWSLV